MLNGFLTQPDLSIDHIRRYTNSPTTQMVFLSDHQHRRSQVEAALWGKGRCSRSVLVSACAHMNGRVWRNSRKSRQRPPPPFSTSSPSWRSCPISCRPCEDLAILISHLLIRKYRRTIEDLATVGPAHRPNRWHYIPDGFVSLEPEVYHPTALGRYSHC